MGEDNTVKELYSLYVSNLKGGVYTIPPLIIIYDILKVRYSSQRVNILNHNPNSLSKVYNIFLDNLEIDSLEFFSIVYESYKDTFHIDILQNSSFITLSPCFQNLTSIDFLIWYPSITITNSKRQKHKIEDLYVNLSILSTGKFSRKFTITRSSYTPEELYYPYKHSHIPSFEINATEIADFQTPCLGRGSIASKISYLRGFNFEEELFIDFLASLDDYLVWESLEGVPYRYINKIEGNKSYLTISSPLSFSNLNNSSQTLLRVLNEGGDISFILKNFCTLLPSIKEDVPYYQVQCDYFEAQKYISKKYPLVNTYFMEKDIWGKVQYSTKKDITILSDRINSLKDTTLFYFGRQKVIFKLLDNKSTISDTQLKIHPQVLHYIIDRIEQSINLKYAEIEFRETV